jgi:hypothetical protein
MMRVASLVARVEVEVVDCGRYIVWSDGPLPGLLWSGPWPGYNACENMKTPSLRLMLLPLRHLTYAVAIE